MNIHMEKKAKLQKILIIFSHLVGRLGSSIFSFGIGLMILRETGSASNFGFTQVIGPVVALLLLPFTGSIIDKVNHKKIVVVAQLSSIFGIVLFLLANNAQILPKLILIYILHTILVVTDLFLDTTYSSSMISMVAKEEVQKIMSIKQMIGTCVMIAAPIVAGFLYNFLSFEQFVIMEITSEIVTLLLVLGINFYMYATEQEEKADDEEVEKNPNGISGVMAMFREGILYVRQSKMLTFVVIFSMFINIVFTSYMVGFPYVIIKYFDFSNAQFGISQVALSFGMLIAGVTLSRKKDIENPLYLAWRLIFPILFHLGLIGLLIFINGSQWFSFFGSIGINLILGILLGMTNIPMQVLMTKMVPQKMQGRVFNLLGTCSQVLMPIGTLFFGMLFDSGVRADIIFIGAAIVGVMISLAIPAVLRVRLQELASEV